MLLLPKRACRYMSRCMDIAPSVRSHRSKWYTEGMAEMGKYWVDGERGVNASPWAIKYLRGEKPRTVDSLLVDDYSLDGNSKEYAWWWSLAHFLQYTPLFRTLSRAGVELLMGKHTGFKEVFGAEIDRIEIRVSLFPRAFGKGFAKICADGIGKENSPS